MTPLSLGMIVRNEAPMLALTLPIYAPFFPSKWALDTGSTDGTVELLQSHGFVVTCTEWRNNYASARNTLLTLKRLATTEGWLLMLDADECMWPSDLLKLQVLSSTTQCDVITLPRVNLASDWRGWLQEVGSWPDKQARCVRLTAPLEYRRPVHEVLHYVNHEANAVGEGRDEFASECPIHHYGWMKSPQECWLRSHNYHLLAKGKLPITEVPPDIAAITRDDFILDLSKRHSIAPFTQPHPLQGRL